MITPYERRCTEKAVWKLYQRMNLPAEPNVVWCESPWQLVTLPVLLPLMLKPKHADAAFCRYGKKPGLVEHFQNKGGICSMIKCRPMSALSQMLWEPLWRRLDLTIDSLRWSGKEWNLGRLMEPEAGELDGIGSFFTDSVEKLLVADIVERVERGYQNRDSRAEGKHLLAEFCSAMIARLPESFPRLLLNMYTQKGDDEVLTDRDLDLSRSFLPFYLRFLISKINFITLGNQGCAVLCFEHTCFVLERPNLISSDSFERLHCDNGPAMVFNDGYDVYALEGKLISPDMIEDPDWLTLERIYDESNQEQKSLMLKRFGLDRFIRESNAEKVAEDECGVLYRKDIPNETPIFYVKVVNSTAEPDGSFKEYFLRVPPYTESAKRAVAWTFGLTEDEYGPVWQT